MLVNKNCFKTDNEDCCIIVISKDNTTLTQNVFFFKLICSVTKGRYTTRPIIICNEIVQSGYFCLRMMQKIYLNGYGKSQQIYQMHTISSG